MLRKFAILFIMAFAVARATPIAADVLERPSSATTSPRISSDEQAVSQLLNRLPLIRVGITGAPGNGHQSAGATVITRLRQLGFTGQIQVIYQADTKIQLGYLLPPFNPSGLRTQDFPQENLQFIELNQFRSQKANAPTVELAILGADDYHMTADAYKSRALLTLQPEDWALPPSLEVLNKKRKLTKLKKLGYAFSLPNPSNPSQFITEQMSHTPELQEKVKGLQAIFSSLDRHEMMGAYGHEFENGTRIATLLEGIEHALRHRPDLFKSGVIVPLISKMDTGQKAHLKRLIENTGLKNHVRIVDVTDLTANEIESYAQPGQILLVHTGAVSKAVFEYIYQQSTLPPTIEGLNTLNLMRLIGKPFLPTSLYEGYDRVEGLMKAAAALGVGDVLERAANGIHSLPLGDGYNQGAQDISEFIAKAREPKSKIAALFQTFRISDQDFQQDQLFLGLVEVEKSLPAWDDSESAPSLLNRIGGFIETFSTRMRESCQGLFQ